MPFDTPWFLLAFLPALLGLYFLAVAAGSLPWRWAPSVSRRSTTLLLIAASVVVVWQGRFGALLLAVALTTALAAVVLQRMQVHGRTGLARALLLTMVSVTLGAFAFTRLEPEARAFVPVGASIVTCLAIAYAIDVYRRQADTTHPLTIVLYLVQMPALAVGPIVRYREFATQHARRAVGMAAFTYGVRRIVIGLIKVMLLAAGVAMPADDIFARGAELAAGEAWLGAACFSLQVYFLFSGYSDIAIGIGRLLGFRYPENFRRPYTADSIREFWRRWNVTLIIWLRDYLYLPIAGRDDPTPRLYANIVFGFVLLGLFHGAGRTVLPWALYSSLWLAFEALGLGARLDRLPAVFRHVYVLCIVMVGWAIMRSDTLPRALAFVSAMAGANGLLPSTPSHVMTPGRWLVFAAAVLCAGPLVPWISRWRVSVDAATVSLMMMIAATGLFLWLGAAVAVDALRPSRLKSRFS